IAASLLVEFAAEPAQEARQADQHEGAGGDEEAGLEIAAENEPLERLGVAVVVGEIAELREQQREVPPGEEQKDEQRRPEHKQDRARREAGGLDQHEAGSLQQRAEVEWPAR